MKRSEIDYWLDYLSYICGEDLKDGVLNELQGSKELSRIQTEDTPLCRHCLFRISILMSTSEESERRIREIQREYDFGGAIIC